MPSASPSAKRRALKLASADIAKIAFRNEGYMERLTISKHQHIVDRIYDAVVAFAKASAELDHAMQEQDRRAA